MMKGSKKLLKGSKKILKRSKTNAEGKVTLRRHRSFSLALTRQIIIMFASRIFQKGNLKILKGSKNIEGEKMPKRTTKMMKGSKKIVKRGKTR